MVAARDARAAGRPRQRHRLPPPLRGARRAPRRRVRRLGGGGGLVPRGRLRYRLEPHVVPACTSSFSSPLGGNSAWRPRSRKPSEKRSEQANKRSDMNDDRVIIFDTTLRDGEQSPGISLNTSEKLEIAQQLARLGVDVIEAGFPIASPGDFEAVQAIAREVEGPVIAGLARVHVGDIDAAYGGRTRRRATSDPHVRLDVGHPHRAPAAASTREDVKGQARAAVAHARSLVDDVEFSPMDATRADVEYTAEVVQIAIDEGATTINIPDTVGYTMPRGVRGVPRPAVRAGARAARRRAVGPLPRRPRAGGRQLVRRRCRRARGRSSARSTGSASARATPRSRRS